MTFIRKRNLIALLQIAYAEGYLQAQIDNQSKDELELPAEFVAAQRANGGLQ